MIRPRPSCTICASGSKLFTYLIFKFLFQKIYNFSSVERRGAKEKKVFIMQKFYAEI